MTTLLTLNAPPISGDNEIRLSEAIDALPKDIDPGLKFRNFDGFDPSGRQSSLPACQEGPHVSFVYRLLLGSMSDDPWEAMAEWVMDGDRAVVMTMQEFGFVNHPEIYEGKSEIGDGLYTSCLCGHAIYNLCRVHNPVTGNTFRIGNCCITKFLPPDVAMDYARALRAKDNAEALKVGEGRLFGGAALDSLIGDYKTPPKALDVYKKLSRRRKPVGVDQQTNLMVACMTYHLVNRISPWTLEDFGRAHEAGRLSFDQWQQLRNQLIGGSDITEPSDRCKNKDWAVAIASLLASPEFKHYEVEPLLLEGDLNGPGRVVVCRYPVENRESFHELRMPAYNPRTQQRVYYKVLKANGTALVSATNENWVEVPQGERSMPWTFVERFGIVFDAEQDAFVQTNDDAGDFDAEVGNADAEGQPGGVSAAYRVEALPLDIDLLK